MKVGGITPPGYWIPSGIQLASAPGVEGVVVGA